MNSKSIKFIAIAAVATMTACGGETKKEEQTVIKDSVEASRGIQSLNPFNINENITIGGKNYSYKIDFLVCDTLPHIINQSNEEWKDNIAMLTISNDTSVVYSHTFSKSDFTQYVPKKMMEYSGLVGFTYNVTNEDTSAFYFIATIGDPDEANDAAIPFEIKLQPGTWTFSVDKATNLETGPVNPMSQDLNKNEGV